MEFTDAVIGARLIETITAGLYDGNLNCIREYVQNSIDSGAQNIAINLENENNLIILDDGNGMDELGIKKALSIGQSDKTGGQIGWRGIGIWSGVSASMRIVIITKMRNSPKYRIVIDNEILRAANQSNDSITAILTNATSDIEELELGKNESLEHDHFTLIRLEGILPTQKKFFAAGEIANFLKKTLPAPFDTENFLLLRQIGSWLNENGIVLPDVNIRFDGEKVYRPPSSPKKYYETFIPYRFTVEGQIVAIGWFLTAKENKELKWPDGGIFFKKKGMTIGNEHLIESFYTSSYNQWQYGEIHILSENIRENAGRNSFEYNSTEFRPFLDQVSKCITELQNMNRYKSDVVKVSKLKSVQKNLDKGNISEVKRELKTIKKGYSNQRSFPENSALISMRNTIDAHAEEVREDLSMIESTIGSSDRDFQAALIHQRKDELRKLIETLPKPVQTSIKRSRGDGLLNPVNTVADSIEELLKRKTGENPTKFIELIETAYGFDRNIKPGKKGPILRVHHNDEKNRRFGLMVYAFYDMIINSYKHEKGQESLRWLEGTNEAERLKIMAQVIAVMGLLYYLVDNSERV